MQKISTHSLVPRRGKKKGVKTLGWVLGKLFKSNLLITSTCTNQTKICLLNLESILVHKLLSLIMTRTVREASLPFL